MRPPVTAVVAAVTVGAAAATAGCGQDTPAAPTQVYKIGCPAVDSAAAAEQATWDAAVEVLDRARKHADLSPQAATWVRAALRWLHSAGNAELPESVRHILVHGCADHGYPLRNLSRASGDS